jgi:hypothetical protein
MFIVPCPENAPALPCVAVVHFRGAAEGHSREVAAVRFRGAAEEHFRAGEVARLPGARVLRSHGAVALEQSPVVANDYPAKGVRLPDEMNLADETPAPADDR